MMFRGVIRIYSCSHCLRCQQKALYHTKTGVYGYKPREEREFALDEHTTRHRADHSNVYRLVQAYRQHGHKKAVLDPLGLQKPRKVPELSVGRYGINLGDSQKLDLTGILYTPSVSLSPDELVQVLEQEYCGPISAEFEHLTTEEEREWFAQTFERKNEIVFSPERKVELAKIQLKSQAFENFLATKFTTVKRYGGEGGETMAGFFDEVFTKSSQNGISNVVVCMPHRGRLSFMTCMLNYPVSIMFKKMKGLSEFPAGAKGSGDVLSHLYSSVDLPYGGKNVHVSFLPNPSHLDAVSPVAVGKARAKQQTLGSGDYGEGVAGSDNVLCIQTHGDGSFSAQGVIAEMFSFASCPNFNVGGCIHLVVNNQLGYTTEAHYGRSSTYCTDYAKINDYPVIHVNGEKPEAVLRATSIAMDYRIKFKKDVVIDLVCYRKSGHNEMDEPSFTQPIMYNVIRGRKTIPDLYAEELTSTGVCSKEELKASVDEFTETLSKEFIQLDKSPIEPYHLQKQWSGYVQPFNQVSVWDTGVDTSVLKFVGAKSVQVPASFQVHPTVQKTQLDRRLQRLEEGVSLDWSAGEALAIGSLLYQGFNVRISGQDVGRGTFSQRHAVLVDQQTDEMIIPLNHITDNQHGFLEVASSVLSEEAVLGFEYGMSLESPKNLVIWEAQFGDFFNGAQIMIDTFVTAGEAKWLLQTGLVMLLPHGYDGAGPEHTSCRIERFLMMCDSKEDAIDGDDVNFNIVNPTTPAQYFHLLRRQMVRNFRKPLVVVAPKMLLRSPAAVSSLADMSAGTSFQPVLGDPDASPTQVSRLVFCSGKHYYALQKEREVTKRFDIAFIRLESLCPFPASEIQAEIAKYSKATEFIWSQEEHRNMGAWSFINPRFENIVGRKLRYVGRGILGLPAVGIGELHQKEAREIVEQTFTS